MYSSIKSPPAISESGQLLKNKNRPQFEVLKSKDGSIDKERGSVSVGVRSKKDSAKTPTTEDPYSHMRAAHLEVKQKVANLSPVLKHRAGSK